MHIDRGDAPPTALASPGSSDGIQIRRRTVGQVTVVSLAGHLDARTAPAAQQGAAAALAGHAPVLLDLAGVRYISSAGLRTLLIVHRRAQQQGVPIALTGVSGPLRSMLSATGFLRFLRVVATIPEGVAALGRDRRAGPPVAPTTS